MLNPGWDPCKASSPHSHLHSPSTVLHLVAGLGEFGDVAYAPVEAFALRFLFGGTGLSVLGFIEEALPFTDAVPTATTGWVLQTLFSDSPLAQLLGVQPLGSKEKDSKDPKKGAL